MDRAQRYPLTDILVLSVLAIIGGADRFVAIARFDQLHEVCLRIFPGCRSGSPRTKRGDESARGWMQPGSKRVFRTGCRDPTTCCA